jgi:murein DD-endopeptidase MepM/ murein hydrolase activator NlpD
MNTIMSFLLPYLCATILVGALLVVATRLSLRFNKRVDYWSALWLSALGLVVILPALSLILSQLDIARSWRELTPLMGHTPLAELTVPAATASEIGVSGAPVIWTTILSGIMALYAIGIIYFGLRLIVGRAHAWAITRHASKATHIDGTPYRLTECDIAPFTLTPFGRPHLAKIVMPKTFLDRLTASEISDILEHEKAHIQRRDDEIALILRSLHVLVWPNIFYGMLFSRWKQSAEIQCDRTGLNSRTDYQRSAYADMLLKALRIMAVRVRQYPTAAFSTQRLRNEKMRINYIMKGTDPLFKRLRYKILIAGTAVIATIAGTALWPLTATAGPTPEKSAENSSQESAKSEKKVKYKAVLVNDISFMVEGRLTSPFGQARDIFKEGKVTKHHGIDIAAPTGTPIYAPDKGRILQATDLYQGKPAYGKVVVLQTAGNTLTVMTHLDGYPVTAGQTVEKGELIARVGNTGKSTAPHVHIETYKNSIRVDPMTVWPFK